MMHKGLMKLAAAGSLLALGLMACTGAQIRDNTDPFGACWARGGGNTPTTVSTSDAGCAAGIRIAIPHKSLSLNDVGFDASLLSVNFSSSLSSPITGTYPVTVTLKNGASVVGSSTFSMQVSGYTGSLVNPSSVNQWLQGYARQFDSLDVETNAAFQQHVGANSVTFEFRYGNQVANGWSKGWYVSDDDNGCAGGDCQIN